MNVLFGGSRAGKDALASRPSIRNHHVKVASVAVTTVATIERTLLDIISDAEERMDLARSAEAEAVEVLAQSM